MQDLRLEEPRAWLEIALGEKFTDGESIPDMTLKMLYPAIYSFGPNGEAVQAFLDSVVGHGLYIKERGMARKLSAATRYSYRGPVKLDQRTSRLIVSLVPSQEGDEDHVIGALRLITWDGFCSHDPFENQFYDKHYHEYMDVFNLNPEDYKWRGSRWVRRERNPY